jgi:pheromone shutdown-related protein TraB
MSHNERNESSEAVDQSEGLVETESTVLDAADAIIDSAADSDTITRITLGERTYILVGTAHVSKDSIADVSRVITGESPDRVCIELDQVRYTSLTQAENWKNLDIFKVIRSGKGFLLMANLMLSSYQKRLGLDGNTKPGAEMCEAVRLCNENNIPFSLIDRDIQVTLRRAWGKSSFWGKAKLLATLLSAAFSNEKMEPEQIEQLKNKSALHGMLEELGTYLPSVKSVLIDERDQHLACRLFDEPGKKLVAVVGAGHVPGMVKWLTDLHEAKASSDVSAIIEVPKPAKVGKILAWIVPIVIVGMIGYAFVHTGWQNGLHSLLTWWLIHACFVTLGTILALGHPVTIILGFIASPLGSVHIAGSVGILTGGIQALVCKPRVSDLENLQNDITTIKGFYRNRASRILLVFILSSLGGVIGNIISIPVLFPKF